MPYRDPEAQRAYGRGWVAARRQGFFADKACVDCGSTEALELDHVDPAEKVSHRIWSWSPPLRAAEISKCVVRCHDCHQARHAAERRIEHSTGGYKRGCRCEVCCEAKRAANRRYSARVQGAPGVEPGCTALQAAASPLRHAPVAGHPTKEEPMERLLMAVVGDGFDIESEPVVIEATENQVALIFEDGKRVVFDTRELVEAAVAA